MPSAVALIPEHYFRTLCQYERCRAKLGGFHLPHTGGTVIFACHACRKVSVFRSETFGIVGHLVDPATGAELDKKTGRPPVVDTRETSRVASKAT